MSRYRYAAVSNHADGTGPLAAYFHGEMMNLPGASASIFDRNKFLAEDRILAFGKFILSAPGPFTFLPTPCPFLTSRPRVPRRHSWCTEIVTKKQAKWRLQYVKSAKAGTDVPSTVPEFISQRRRWLNGWVPTFASSRREPWRNGKGVGADDRSIFAAVYAMVCFWRIWTSGHGFMRKIMLNLITIYSMFPFPAIHPHRYARIKLEGRLTHRLDQLTVQLALCFLFLSGFLLPHRFFDFDWIRPFRWSWAGYFRCVQ